MKARPSANAKGLRWPDGEKPKVSAIMSSTGYSSEVSGSEDSSAFSRDAPSVSSSAGWLTKRSVSEVLLVSIGFSVVVLVLLSGAAAAVAACDGAGLARRAGRRVGQAQLPAQLQLASLLTEHLAPVLAVRSDLGFQRGEVAVHAQRGGLRLLQLVDLAARRADPRAGCIRLFHHRRIEVGGVAWHRRDETLAQHLFQPQRVDVARKAVGDRLLAGLHVFPRLDHRGAGRRVVGLRVVLGELLVTQAQARRDVAQQALLEVSADAA